MSFDKKKIADFDLSSGVPIQVSKINCISLHLDKRNSYQLLGIARYLFQVSLIHIKECIQKHWKIARTLSKRN